MAKPLTWWMVLTQTRTGRPQLQTRQSNEQSARTVAQSLSLSGNFLAVKLYRVHKDKLGLEAKRLVDTWRNASAYTTREEYARSVKQYGGAVTNDEGDDS